VHTFAERIEQHGPSSSSRKIAQRARIYIRDAFFFNHHLDVIVLGQDHRHVSIVCDLATSATYEPTVSNPIEQHVTRRCASIVEIKVFRFHRQFE